MPKGEKKRRLTTEQRSEVVRLYQTRHPDGTWISAGDIARQFGVTNGCVIYHLKLANIATRSASESHMGKACKPVTHIPRGERPFCKCGCGLPTEWDQHKDAWEVYYPGHYRMDAPYKHRDWLEAEYTLKGRTVDSLAIECGVGASSILKAMRKLGIPVRPHAESLTLNGAVSGANNPAWKGGVAAWPYSSDWKALARRIRKRDGYTCQRCHERRTRWGIYLHVHHIDGDKTNNAPMNLIALCAACHHAVHAPVLTPSPHRSPAG